MSGRLVDATGASLVPGGYKTTKLIFSQARKEHVPNTYTAVPPEVALRKAQVGRAVERGRGPAKPNSFFVEDVIRIIEITSEFEGTHSWAHIIEYRVHAVIICCWWLLRGSEAPSVKLNQAWTEITHSDRTAFITLPCAKTDIVGLCVTRSHPCSCHRSPGCGLFMHYVAI